MSDYSGAFDFAIRAAGYASRHTARVLTIDLLLRETEGTKSRKTVIEVVYQEGLANGYASLPLVPPKRHVFWECFINSYVLEEFKNSRIILLVHILQNI